jgi:hypothetical protein
MFEMIWFYTTTFFHGRGFCLMGMDMPTGVPQCRSVSEPAVRPDFPTFDGRGKGRIITVQGACHGMWDAKKLSGS